MKRKDKKKIDGLASLDFSNLRPKIREIIEGLFKEVKDEQSDTPSDSITQRLQDSFETFIDIVPARRLGQNIRKLLLCFLTNELEEGIDENFEIYMKDLSDFFEFLDTIEEEYDQSDD